MEGEKITSHLVQDLQENFRRMVGVAPVEYKTRENRLWRFRYIYFRCGSWEQ